MNLLDDRSFRPTGGIDGIVLDEFGVYAIRLRSGAAIPGPLQSHLNGRATRVLYSRRAEKQTLLELDDAMKRIKVRQWQETSQDITKPIAWLLGGL